MSMIRKFSHAPAAAALVLGSLAAFLATPASATPTLKLDDGVGPIVIVADGSGLDASAAPGVVKFSGPLGTWLPTIDTGSVISGAPPIMNLTWASLASAPGTLTVQFSEVGFTTAPVLEALFSAGGTNGGGSSVSVKAWYDTTDVLFGTGTLLFASGPHGTPGWSDAQVNAALAGLTAPYSLTIEVAITAVAPGLNTGSATVEVPEPFTSAVLGLGLLGLGFARRRFKRG